MSRNTLIVIAVILAVLIGGWFLTRPKSTPAPATVESTPAIQPTNAPSASEGAAVKEKNVVNILSSGFSPQNITVKAGESVTWMNTDNVDHTVNSAVHPTHLVYPPLNLGVIKPSESKSLAFPTAGTYKYHDHLNPSLTGSVTVQ